MVFPGGGQPGDHGLLGGLPVVDVQHVVCQMCREPIT